MYCKKGDDEGVVVKEAAKYYADNPDLMIYVERSQFRRYDSEKKRWTPYIGNIRFFVAENAVKEFGKADLAIIGGDNVSDYPEWDKSCALPKKNFLDLKYKLNAVAENTTKSGKVLYVAGNNDFILGDIGTVENQRTILPIFTIVWKNRSVNFPKPKN